MRNQLAQLSLRIFHPSNDLSITCRSLGLKPKVLWRAGEERRTPKGNAIGGLRANSYCLIEFGRPRRKPFANQMENALAQVVPHRRLLKRLASTGGKISFAVAWFCDEHTGASLDSSLLSELAGLKIGIELFVYAPDAPISHSTQKARPAA
jgi:hypothetical protein